MGIPAALLGLLRHFWKRQQVFEPASAEEAIHAIGNTTADAVKVEAGSGAGANGILATTDNTDDTTAAIKGDASGGDAVAIIGVGGDNPAAIIGIGGTGVGVSGTGTESKQAGVVGEGGPADASFAGGPGVTGTGGAGSTINNPGSGVEGFGADAAGSSDLDGATGTVGEGGERDGTGKDGVGVWGLGGGQAAGATVDGQGVIGEGRNTGSGVEGLGGSSSGIGVKGTGGGSDGSGVRGTGGGSSGVGVEGLGQGENGQGVAGTGGAGAHTGGVGVKGSGGSPTGDNNGGRGVWGLGTNASGSGNNDGGGGVVGVGGDATGSGTDGAGVKGTGGGTTGIGVEGIGSADGVGVKGTGGSGGSTGIEANGGIDGGVAIESFGADATTTDNDGGGAVEAVAGAGDGAGDGGVAVACEGGAGGATADGGNGVEVGGGDGGATSGNGGHGVDASGGGTTSGAAGSGVKGTGGAGGYGVEAHGDTGGSPVRSALHVAPQDADSSTAVNGNILTTTASHPSGIGNVRFHDGTSFQSVLKDKDYTAADEVMVGTGAGIHSQVTLGASEFLAKGAAGAVGNKTAAEARTILNVEDNADVTDSTNVNASLTAIDNETQMAEVSILLDAALSGDEKWSGISIAGTAGAALTVGQACYLGSDEKWYPNDGILDGTDTGFKSQLGICILVAAGDTDPTKMLLYGKVRSVAFPAFTVGAPVYLDDTAGNIVVAQPSTANFAIRIVGFALSAEELMFAPSPDYTVVE